MEKETVRLREKHMDFSAWELAVDPFGSLFFAQFVDSQLKAREMLRQMHITDGRLRLATLLVQLIDENVQDRDIPQFLATADRRLFDPFTSDPALWDPKDRKIYFVDPTNKCAVASWFRVRDVKRPAAPSSSLINTNAC